MAAASFPPVPRIAPLLLGFALGGFFDGIVLHQVLQWHHLLSNVGAVRTLRTQLLADGLFHALMYVIAAYALVRLWRGSGAGSRHLLAWVLAGFAAWQAIDAVAFHWLIGLHRIRVGVPNPLAWDLGWLLVFGLPPAVAAAWMLHGPPGSGLGRPGAAAVALFVSSAAAAAAWPASTPGDEAVVVFAPGVSAAQAFDALSRLHARVLWVDGSGGAWAVQWPSRPPTLALLREGAWLASGTPLGLGCVAWTARPV